MTNIDGTEIKLSTRREKRKADLAQTNGLTPVKLAIINIEEGITTLSWDDFFTTEDAKGIKTPIPISKLCSTYLPTQFKKQAEKTKHVLEKYTKVKAKHEIAIVQKDIKTSNLLATKMAALEEELLSGMNPLRKPILDYFNDLTLLFKLLYSFKNRIPLEDTVDIQMNMIKLMQETRTIRFYDLKTPFYDFNDLRNIVAHNSVTSFITEADWLAFADMVASIDESVRDVVKRYSAPFEKAQKLLT